MPPPKPLADAPEIVAVRTKLNLLSSDVSEVRREVAEARRIAGFARECQESRDVAMVDYAKTVDQHTLEVRELRQTVRDLRTRHHELMTDVLDLTSENIPPGMKERIRARMMRTVADFEEARRTLP